MLRRTFRVLLIAIGSILLAGPVRAQIPAGDTASAAAAVTVRPMPTKLRVQIELRAYGKTPEVALQNLAAQRAAAIARLKQLKADAASTAFGIPRVNAAAPAGYGGPAAGMSRRKLILARPRTRRTPGNGAAGAVSRRSYSWPPLIPVHPRPRLAGVCRHSSHGWSHSCTEARDEESRSAVVYGIRDAKGRLAVGGRRSRPTRGRGGANPRKTQRQPILAGAAAAEKLSPEEQRQSRNSSGPDAARAEPLRRNLCFTRFPPGSTPPTVTIGPAPSGPPSPSPVPTFIFVATLSAAERKAAIAKAFTLAKRDIENLAEAAGMKLGTIARARAALGGPATW